MKKLLLFLLLSLAASCSSDDGGECQRVYGAEKTNCDEHGCEYYIYYGQSIQVQTNKATYDYYRPRIEAEEKVCWEGEK